MNLIIIQCQDNIDHTLEEHLQLELQLDDIEIKQQVAGAMYEKGDRLYYLNRYDDAIKAYDACIQKFSNETEDEVTADVRVSPNAMKFWAMQYGEYVTVISPESLVNEVKTALQKAAEKYGK